MMLSSVAFSATLIALVVAAAMFAAVMLLAMMLVTRRICDLPQVSGSKSFGRLIGASADSGIELDSSLIQSHLRSPSDAAADKNISLSLLQEACQGSVSLTVCICDLFFYNCAVLNIIQLELLRMTEMLEHLSVLISHCDSHTIISFLRYIAFKIFMGKAILSA